MKYLFVCGAPRSGTTAMWKFLAEDKNIIMGVERYGNLFFKEPLTKNLFEKKRFLDIQEGDTFYSELVTFNPYYKDLNEKFDTSEIVGDKIPLLFKYLDGLFREIPEARVVIMLRNIIDLASSYEDRAGNPKDNTWSENKKTAEAIEDWRDSLKAIKNWIDDKRVKVVVYEDFFHGDLPLEDLYDFIDLELNQDAIDRFKSVKARASDLEGKRERKLDLDAVSKICENAPFGLYREILNKVRNI